MIAVFALISWANFAGAEDIPLQDGDIIFQRSLTRQSYAVAAATHSQHTHMGIVFYERGVPYVYEAVNRVRKTKLKDWVRRGKNGRFVVRRLKDTSKVDTGKLKREVMSFLGKDYDLLFDWSDSKMYCSELVWKAYQRSCGIQIGALKRLGQFDLDHDVVRKIMSERYGDDIPRGMKVISPSDIYDSRLLMTVHRR